MPGYDAHCANCVKCQTCQGTGVIDVTRSERGIVYTERNTCKTCKGAGGTAGAGNHDHS